VIECAEIDGSVTFRVRVLPRSSRSEIVGEHDGALKIKLKSPPVDGAANEELIRFLAKELSIPRAMVTIISGQTSRTKRISVQGFSAAAITAILQAKI
jgi:uncharacterized protein (TIGR00251 family)